MTEYQRPRQPWKFWPPKFPELTPEQIDREYETLKGFYEAYPAPETKGEETLEELEALDRMYDQALRRHGINPKAPIHPEVMKRLIRDSGIVGEFIKTGVSNKEAL